MAGRSGSAGRESSLTGKIMAGMKSTKCPTCKGEGKVPGAKVGSTLAWIDPCPQCAGERHIRGDLSARRKVIVRRCSHCLDAQGRSRGEVNGKTCHACKGSGKRVLVFEQVNPASIRPTGPRGLGVFSDDPLSEQIDNIISGWSRRRHLRIYATVILSEHCDNGRQQDKAAKLKISQGWFARLLSQAYTMLGNQLAP